MPRDLGQKLLSGAAGPAHAARAERIRAVVRAVVGDGPPSAPPLPDLRSPAAPKLLPLRGNVRARAEAEKVGQAVIDGFLNRELDAVAKHAHPWMWMLWPEGQLSKHATPALIDALKKRDGAPAPLIPGEKRSYTAAEMRSVFARGVPDAIEKMIEAQNAIAVSMVLESKRGDVGTVMVLVSLDAEGVWRAHNILLPAIDEAVRAGVAPSPAEDEAVRFADRIVRHFVLGHDRPLKALRNHFFDRVLIGEELATPERVVELAAFGPERIAAADVVFGGSSLGSIDDLAAVGAVDRVKRKAQEIWKRPYEKLQLRIVKTKLDDRTALSIMIGVREGEIIRWRLGGLFV